MLTLFFIIILYRYADSPQPNGYTFEEAKAMCEKDYEGIKKNFFEYSFIVEMKKEEKKK